MRGPTVQLVRLRRREVGSGTRRIYSPAPDQDTNGKDEQSRMDTHRPLTV